MLGDFKGMNPKEFVTNRIINPIKSVGRSKSIKPRNSKGVVVVSLISLAGLLSSAALLSFVPGKIEIREIFAASAYASQQHATVSDPLSDSLQIAQSKVQSATAPGAFGHGVPSLYNISIQDLLTILGITGVGCILTYFIARALLNRIKEKEEKNKTTIIYQR
jgi:hypothetical protein